jgi:heme exporter protein C
LEMWWKILILIVLAWVCIGAWIFPPPTPVKDSPEVFRIVYFHFPMAIATVVAFGTAMFYSIRYLSTHDMRYDLREVSAARLGIIFCVLAAVSGSIFAKNTWGSYWNWDPRETSIFMLLLVYAAYFALRSAVADPDQKANLSAVYSLFGFVATIFLIFIMPRIMPGLHPGAPKPSGGSEGSIITFSFKTASVLIPSVLAHIGLFFWINKLAVVIAEADKERINV